MEQWRSQITILALTLMSVLAHAGEFGFVKCEDCHYKSERLILGGTKSQAMRGQSTKIFFCQDTKKFIGLTTGKNGQATKSAKGFTAKECPKGLTLLEDYKDKPCPVCNKGKVEFVSEGFVD